MKPAISTNWNSRGSQDGALIVEECLKAGAEAIELGYALTHRQAEDIRGLRSSGLVTITSVHAYCPVPMGALSGHPELFSICDRFATMRKRARSELLKTARFAVDMGAATVVLHAGRVPVWRTMRAMGRLAEKGGLNTARYNRLMMKILHLRDRRSRYAYKRLLDALSEILPEFEKLGVTLALENLPTWDALPNESEMLQLVNEFPDLPLAYWHDFGHGQVRENMGFTNHRAVAKLLRKHTAGYHVHDVRPPADDHVMPPGGSIDFAAFKDILAPGAPLVIEPAPGTPFEKVCKAVDFLREVWA